jgi:PAS domain S-box-containing protein
MKLTIRTKLLIGFSLFLLLSSIIQTFVFNLTNQYVSSQIELFQTDQAKKGAAEVEDFLTTLSLDNFGLASVLQKEYTTKGNFSSANIQPVTTYILKNKDYTKKITILSPQGKELLQFDVLGEVAADKLNYEVVSTPFTTAVSGQTALSSVYFIENQQGPFLDMFSPVYGSNGKVIGVVKTQVTLVKLEETIRSIKFGENGYLYVVDNVGRLIAHHTSSFVSQRPDLTSRKIISETLQNKPLSSESKSYINEKNVPVVAQAVKTAGYDWVVIFEQPTEEAYAFLTIIRNLFLATFVGSTIFLFLIAFILSANLTNSIRKLQQSAKLLEQGQLTTNIDIKTGDEIETLSHSFATMVNQLLQRETSLQREKRETDTLLQSLTEGVVALDQRGMIIAFNRAAERATGFTGTEVIGKPVDEVLHFYESQHLIPFTTYSQQNEEMIKKLKDKGMRLSNKEGQKVSLSLTVSPVLFEAQKSGFIVAFHDISAEQELEEMKLDFVSIAAHELRTPLTAIRGYASLLQLQNSKDLDDSGKELISRLVVSGENLGNLIENLLSVSRIERSMFSVDARPVDLTTTIKNVIDNVRPQALTKQQTINILVPDQLPVVLADSFRIGQVVLNFVANAVNYTQPGGSITVKTELKDNSLQVLVTDTGRGIPKEALQKLFTKFFRVSGSLEQGSKGTGLGLYISKSIIEMHKGKIWVESEAGKGSTFAFSLPIATPSEITAYQQKRDLTPKNGQVMIGKKL